MSKTEIIKNRENLLCEIFFIANKCKYTIYPEHISFEWGGMENEIEIDGVVICASREDADRCVTAIADLLDNGYGEELNWYVALDIADITSKLFNGELMRYFHMEINNGISPAFFEKIREALVGYKMVFVYLHLHQLSDITSVEGTLAQILPKGITDSWLQVSLYPDDVCEFVEIWCK